MVATVGLITPGAVHPGDSFWVGFATDSPLNDYIDIVPAGAADTATPLVHLDTTWQAAGQINMHVPASAAVGTYELRLKKVTGVQVAAASFPVVAATSNPGPGPTPPGKFDLSALLHNPLAIGAVGLILATQLGLLGGRRR